MSRQAARGWQRHFVVIPGVRRRPHGSLLIPFEAAVIKDRSYPVGITTPPRVACPRSHAPAWECRLDRSAVAPAVRLLGQVTSGQYPSAKLCAEDDAERRRRHSHAGAWERGFPCQANQNVSRTTPIRSD